MNREDNLLKLSLDILTGYNEETYNLSLLLYDVQRW
jgi:hypothetical protein